MELVLNILNRMFIDYAKAFGHVDHSTLVRKLYNLNVPQFLYVGYVSFKLIACSVLSYRNTYQNVQLSGIQCHKGLG